MQIISDISAYLCEQGLIHISPDIAFEAQFLARNGVSYLDASEFAEAVRTAIADNGTQAAYNQTGEEYYIEAYSILY